MGRAAVFFLRGLFISAGNKKSGCKTAALFPLMQFKNVISFSS